MLDAGCWMLVIASKARRVAASRAAWGWLWPITINQSPKMLAFFDRKGIIIFLGILPKGKAKAQELYLLCLRFFAGKTCPLRV